MTVDEYLKSRFPLAPFRPLGDRDGIDILIGPEGGFAEEERALKRFLYAKLYESPQLEQVREEAERIVANLATAYRSDPSLLPEAWQCGTSEIEQLRTIGDFIAGMTDRFAIARHDELVGPVQLPDSF